MLIALQGVQPWVGPTMAISLVVIALSFVAIAFTFVAAGLAVSKQAKKLREQTAGLQEDARKALRSMRRTARNVAEASDIVKHEAHLFAETGRGVRERIDDVADTVHERIEDLDALYEVVADEVEDAAVGVAATVRSLLG